RLQGGGETLSLQRPDHPDLDTNTGSIFLPYIDVDVVHYNDKAPWPVIADGMGASLERLYATAYGNDPINWRANPSGPSPGAENIPLPPQTQINSVSWSGGVAPTFHLSFRSVPGQTCTVQYCDSLTKGAWFKLADFAAESSIQLREVIASTPPTSQERFYRIVSPWQR